MQSGGYLCRWVGYVRKRGTAGSRNKKMISRSWNLLKTCLALLLLLFAFIAECQLLASSRRLILFKFQHRHLVSEYYVVQSRLNEKANHFVYYNSIHSRIETSCLQRAQSIPTQLCAKDTHTQRIRKKENFGWWWIDTATPETSKTRVTPYFSDTRKLFGCWRFFISFLSWYNPIAQKRNGRKNCKEN